MAQKDSKHVFQQKLWLGISNLLKEPSSKDPDQPTNFYYGENVNIRTDPYAPTLNYATVKESGSTVVDFVKWADITPAALTVYAYGDQGNIYSRTLAGSWTNLHKAGNSHGNGLQYFYGDDYLYYTTDSAIGRYGPLASSPQFSDDFLTAQGGTPQNTNSLALIAASSQYGYAADSASLSVTSDLTLEAYTYFNSLPAVGSSMVVLGKWDESGATRSYVMDIFGVSGLFGSGTDGSLTISSNATEAPIDSACTGTAGNYTLTATNVSFALNQAILIHQTQGTSAGQYERNVVSGYTAGTITLQTPLIGTYTTGAQVRVLKQYTNVTVNTGITYTAKAWNGTTGGILAFLANGTVTVTGNIVADGCGFRGASAVSNEADAYQGEGTGGVGSVSNLANGNGGGGGQDGQLHPGGFPFGGAGGGGGSNSTTGIAGNPGGNGVGGNGGSTSGSSDLTTIVFGGGGGGGGSHNNTGSTSGGTGGAGGGIALIIGAVISITGAITSNGEAGQQGQANHDSGGGGGGAAGSILIKAQTAALGTDLIIATGGAGGAQPSGGTTGGLGGNGGNGYCVIDYLTSYTGTTTPTLNAIQDNTLVTTTTYQARLGISNDGTANEYLTKNLPNLVISQWNRLSISWAAASSLATFYLNGASLGTTTGTKTAIHDNTSLLYVGAKKGASAVGSFMDGIIDDVRIWGSVQSAGSIATNCNHQLSASMTNLKAYYMFNAAATDFTSNANNLTLSGSPAYSSLVPFVDPTVRLDIDQSFTTTGFTYTLPTAISEATSDVLPFTPQNDPQKSMDVNVDTKGTGDWTVTIHDQMNSVIASKTIVNASMAASGYQEFTWATPWRIVIGKSYHAHITVSTGTSKIVSSVASTLQSGGVATGDFHSYFQYLVTDTQFHSMTRWLNFVAIGNERYVAKWDGAFYTPNLIAFPAGTHVRCFGTWGIYLAIGTWQEASSGTPNVYDFATGKIYFWDGISLTYNFAIDVPEGQVNAIFGMDSDLYYFAGWKGDLMYYQGSWANQSGSFNGTKIKRIPYIEQSSYVEVYPQAMANYQGLLYMGLGANTNSNTLPQGVYSWGALYPDYPKSLSFEHIISTGNKGSSVSIGMVYPVQESLLVSWSDGIAYGVDSINPSNGIYHTSGQLQTNIQDGGFIYQNDLLLKIRGEHIKLNTGESMQVGYKLDREANFETSNSITDPLKKFTANTLMNGRATEMQFQVQLMGNGSSSPTLLALGAQMDSLPTELAF